MGKQWVVVADQARARIYEAGAAGELREIASFENASALGHVRDLGSDRPGRRGDSFGHRHALGGEQNQKREGATKFAHEIRDYLDAARRAHEFDALTLAMPPHFLGLLRKALDPECAKVVERVIGKDFMHYGEAELRTRLAEADQPAS